MKENPSTNTKNSVRSWDNTYSKNYITLKTSLFWYDIKKCNYRAGQINTYITIYWRLEGPNHVHYPNQKNKTIRHKNIHPMTEHYQYLRANIETVLSSITEGIGRRSRLHNKFVNIWMPLNVHEDQDVHIWNQLHVKWVLIFSYGYARHFGLQQGRDEPIEAYYRSFEETISISKLEKFIAMTHVDLNKTYTVGDYYNVNKRFQAICLLLSDNCECYSYIWNYVKNRTLLGTDN